MTKRFFGTDGVRGPYGGEQINEEFFRRLALAAARFFSSRPDGAERTAVIGRDTRPSGRALANAAIEGLARAGWRVIDFGVAPTPAVALGVVREKALFGAMITASHNPANDNGIKFFSSSGEKLSDADEEKIEAALDAEDVPAAASASVEKGDAVEPYVASMSTLLSAGALKGWKIAVDTGNGATGATTPRVFANLGAEVVRVDEPGKGAINDGVGSEHPEALAVAVRERGAVIGIAHDGDGDRAIFCDETGSLLSGDEALAIVGYYGVRFGQLRGNALVVSRQSNTGLDLLLERTGGRVVRTDVGDRFVSEAMRQGKFNTGGEASGHWLLTDVSPAGDGLAGALRLIGIMGRTGLPLSRLRSCFQPVPQRVANLRVGEKRPLESLSTLPEAIAVAERRLGKKGRVMVRYSGTEPMIRLLAEGQDVVTVEEVLTELVEAARTDLEVVES